jgi:hypothetical protein
MLIVPDAPHGLPAYTIRKGWDYFVRNLLGGEPPAGYEMIARPQFPGAGGPDDPDWMNPIVP